MTQAMVFTLLIPLAVLAALGLVLVSGRLRPETRARVETVLALVFYPAATLWWLWNAWMFASRQEWLGVVLMAVAAAVFALQGVRAVRERRFLPQRRPAS